MPTIEAELEPSNGPKGSLSADSYHSPAIFETEISKIFGSRFQFACLTSEVANDRDFVCIDHAGASIVVQNFKGVIKAFQNICTHRFNRIQTEERGNRPLTCMYHGWTFDAEGFPAGMPKREQFLVGGDTSHLCLPQYRVEVCGIFVFLAEKDETLSLEEHLGQFFPVLRDLSAHLGPQVLYSNVHHAANWKLLVENVVECYHCSTVHRETFIPQGFGRLPIEQLLVDGEHTSSHFPRAPAAQEDIRRRYLSHLKSRSFSHDSYYHIFIFPNLFISSTEGMTFYVGQALPISAGETILRMRYFEPNLTLAKRHRTRQDEVTEQSNTIGLALIEEDRTILESIQRNVRLARRRGMIGDEEVRIRMFWESYLARMSRAAGHGD